MLPTNLRKPATATESSVRDCFAITKALVEMKAGVVKEPPADLEARIVRALLGYLTQPCPKSR